MTYVAYGTFALCLAMLIILIRIMGTLGEVLDLAKRQGDVHVGKFRASIFDDRPSRSSRHYASVKGWAIWVHQDGQWRLEDDMCSPGFRPGDPPRTRGTYEGQRVKQEGIAK